MKIKSIFVVSCLFLFVSCNSQVTNLRQGAYYTEEQGKENLAKYASTYSDKESWTKRASKIKATIRAGAKLETLPGRCPLAPEIGRAHV